VPGRPRGKPVRDAGELLEQFYVEGRELQITLK
jgi:hypothetical protein